MIKQYKKKKKNTNLLYTSLYPNKPSQLKSKLSRKNFDNLISDNNNLRFSVPLKMNSMFNIKNALFNNQQKKNLQLEEILSKNDDKE